MVQCFDAACNHYSESHSCRFFRIPINSAERQKWERVIERRLDRQPNGNSRVCSCHFKDGLRKNGPTIFHDHADIRLNELKRWKTRKKILVIKNRSAIKTPPCVPTGPPYELLLMCLRHDHDYLPTETLPTVNTSEAAKLTSSTELRTDVLHTPNSLSCVNVGSDVNAVLSISK